MRLHQLNQASYSAELQRDLHLCLQPGDCILLIEAAVLLMQFDPDQLLNQLATTTPLFALQTDVAAFKAKLNPNVTLIDHTTWLALAVKYSQQTAW
jgi:sulfur relay protein TusB/DsrH